MSVSFFEKSGRQQLISSFSSEFGTGKLNSIEFEIILAESTILL